ncbi:hypothetical protein [Virgibacillus ihumii]|uniref:hypothetical protein n=1 Tax=Virgibacillus ihumii TaxID=2686091 RepID=UPI00157D8A4F|nr:hypothetical protein [Virgibacillus ihumii]
MYQYKLYNSGEITRLEQELDVYKHILETIKLGDMVENYLKTNSEFYELKFEFHKLKGEMKSMEKNYQETVEEYGREEQDLSESIKTINDSLSELKRDMDTVMNLVAQIRFAELSEKVDKVIHKLDSGLTDKNEMKGLQEEVSRLTDQLKPETAEADTQQQQSAAPKKSEFRRLQSMLRSPQNIEQASNKKKNNMTPIQNFGKPVSGSKRRSTQTNSFNQNESNIQNINGRKVYQNPQYEINKNIITSKNKQQKNNAEANEGTSVNSRNNNPNSSNKNTSFETEETETNNTEKEHENSMENPNTQENHQEFQPQSETETENRNIAADVTNNNNEEEKHSSEEDNQSGSKNESNSFFSFFRKG